MTEDKWAEIYYIELSNTIGTINFMDMTPENFPFYKATLLKFVHEMEKATEVYNMENERK